MKAFSSVLSTTSRVRLEIVQPDIIYARPRPAIGMTGANGPSINGPGESSHQHDPVTTDK